MRQPRHKCSSALVRRRLLQDAAIDVGLGGAGLASRPARADNATAQSAPAGSGWHKFSKQVAGYVETGHGEPEICGMCHYFLDPDQCVIVEGTGQPAPRLVQLRRNDRLIPNIVQAF
jgi:hypothetical protein